MQTLVLSLKQPFFPEFCPVSGCVSEFSPVRGCVSACQSPRSLLEAAGLGVGAFPCRALGAISWIGGGRSLTRTQLVLTHHPGCICSLDLSTLAVST